MSAPRLPLALLALACVLPAGAAPKDGPLALHPDNPRYFLFRGKPAVLITSGEHYGAVLNRDFDIMGYLDELAAHGLTLTRTFTGVYCEDTKSFRRPGRLTRVTLPGWLADAARPIPLSCRIWLERLRLVLCLA